VAIIPMLDDGRLVMVRQYRFPLARVMLEFPAGKIEPGEPQLDCARRELAEETGYVAREWAFAGEINNAPAYSNESIWLWFARGLVPGATRLDVGEFVETVTLSLEELEAIDLAGQLADVKTLIGMHWLRQWRSGLRAAAWQIEPHVQAAR
jgi:ADP-ribose pyrophosphatase